MAAGAISERPLEIVVRLDAPFPVRSEVIAATPFVRLVRLRRTGPQRRRFVLLAPHSGYATAVISQLVTTLLALGEVVVTDWIDARWPRSRRASSAWASRSRSGSRPPVPWAARRIWSRSRSPGPAALAAAALLAARYTRS